MDELSNVYGDAIIDTYLPLFEDTMKNSDPLIKELGVLSLGTIAIGCNMEIYVNTFMPYLIECMKVGNHPSLRGISYWTSSRYIFYILQSRNEKCFQSIIEQILIGIGDRNKIVEEYACSALSEIIENSYENIIPYTSVIIPVITKSYSFYQLKSMQNLLDVTSCICRILYYNDVNNKDFFNEIINVIFPLFKNYNNLDNTYALILNTMSDIILCFGIHFQELAPEIYQQCLLCIEKYLKEEEAKNNNNEYVDVFIGSVAIIGSLVQKLGSAMNTLLQQSNINQFIINSIQSNNPDTIKTCLGLLGDLINYCYSYIESTIPTILNKVISFIRVDYQERMYIYIIIYRYFSICNNSIWVISVLIPKLKEKIQPYVESIINSYKELITYTKTYSNDYPEKELICENLIIGMGRLCMLYPKELSIIHSFYINFWSICESLLKYK